MKGMDPRLKGGNIMKRYTVRARSYNEAWAKMDRLKEEKKYSVYHFISCNYENGEYVVAFEMDA